VIYVMTSGVTMEGTAVIQTEAISSQQTKTIDYLTCDIIPCPESHSTVILAFEEQELCIPG
jgi:hypothetical protein